MSGVVNKKKKSILIVVSFLLAIILTFFTVDLVRAKNNLPPVFCIKAFTCANGNSTDYYGLGYKVWEDYHPFDCDVHYYVGFWILPKTISI